MRHAPLHRQITRARLARPRAPSRADAARARVTNIVLAILGVALIGALCLFVAIGSGLGS